MKEKVNVAGVPETMVQTLYARAKETRKKNAKINDEIAVELVKKLDYDFSKADKDNAMTYGVIARTIVLDRMVEQYLKKHANTCKYGTEGEGRGRGRLEGGSRTGIYRCKLLGSVVI